MTTKWFVDAAKTGAKLVKFAVNCDDQPAIIADGSTATQLCHEKSQWENANQTNTPFTYTFVKTGGKWVLSDRKFLK
jgi:hypothetical protein